MKGPDGGEEEKEDEQQTLQGFQIVKDLLTSGTVTKEDGSDKKVRIDDITSAFF